MSFLPTVQPSEVMQLAILTNGLSLASTIVGVAVAAFMTSASFMVACDVCVRSPASQCQKLLAVLMTGMAIILTCLDTATLFKGTLGVVTGSHHSLHFMDWPIPITIWLQMLVAIIAQMHFTKACYSIWKKAYLPLVATVLMLCEVCLTVSSTLQFINWQNYGITRSMLTKPVNYLFWIGISATVFLNIGLFAVTFLSLKKTKLPTVVFTHKFDRVLYFVETLFDSYFLVAVGIVFVLWEQSNAHTEELPYDQVRAFTHTFASGAIMARLYILSCLFNLRRGVERIPTYNNSPYTITTSKTVKVETTSSSYLVKQNVSTAKFSTLLNNDPSNQDCTLRILVDMPKTDFHAEQPSPAVLSDIESPDDICSKELGNF